MPIKNRNKVFLSDYNARKWMEKVYVILNAKKDEITLEAILQHGDEELLDLEDFLPLGRGAGINGRDGCKTETYDII